MSAFTNTVAVAVQNAVSAPAPAQDWPLNGWAMYGGYQISSQGEQFTDNPSGLPMLTWNTEKDVLIVQGLGWQDSTLLDTAAQRFKTFKDISPNSRLLYYYIASEPTKVIQGSSVGYNDEVRDLINSPTRGDSQTWYLRNGQGNLVESQFDPVLFHRANCYATQFQNNNSFGRNFAEQFLQEHYDNFSVTRSNGERIIDLLDGLYWDVVDAAPERVFVDGSNGATSEGIDQNQDGSEEGRFDETIPTPTTNEDGYGGARMHRRGIADWVSTFESIFAGTDFVLWGNGTNDGLFYDIGGLSTGDSVDTSELYQLMDGTIHERIGNSVGTNDNGTDYDIPFNPSVETGLKRHIFMLERLKTSGTHPWGNTYGRTGSHMMVLDMNTRSTEAGITTTDYEYANFYAGLNALCGTCFAPYMNPGDPFPRPDTYIYIWGDPIEATYPERIATVDETASGMDVTLRAYDYTSGSADFWWEEFENVLWVVRGDTTGVVSGDNFGDGVAVACELPDPGTGKKWVYADLRNYTNPNTGWTTRNQLPSIYDGSDVDAGGTYGSVSLKPFESVMLARVDEDAGGGSDVTAQLTELNLIRERDSLTCYSGIQLDSDGDIMVYNASNSQSDSGDDWLLTGAAADAWVEASFTPGTGSPSVQGSATGTRLQLSTLREWYITDNSVDATATTGNLTLTIYDASSGGNQLAQRTYFLSASRTS